MKLRCLGIRATLTMVLLIINITINACETFLDVPAPYTETSSGNVFKDKATANSAILSIYSQIEAGEVPFYISIYLGMMGDDFQCYSTNIDDRAFYLNTVDPSNANLLNFIWKNAYKYIYQANSIIENLDKSSIDGPVKDQIIGEALFMRSYQYFYLATLFGDVPLATSVDYKANSVLPRAVKSKVLEIVVADLQRAAALMSPVFVGADGMTPSNERIRANKWAALALLARCYLQMGDYASALNAASQVIGQKSIFQLVNPADAFKKNSMETILALQPTSSSQGYLVPEANGYIIQSIPETGVKRSVTMSEELLHLFDTGDTRLVNWIGVTGAYKFPFKYKSISGSGVEEYSILFRLAEMYLIGAECNLALNNKDQSLKDLNEIRKRAGLSDFNSMNGSDILLEIHRQWRLEYFAESGLRWMTILRDSNLSSIMTAAALKKGTTWQPYKSLLPIPQAEILNNPELSQNSGYQ